MEQAILETLRQIEDREACRILLAAVCWISTAGIFARPCVCYTAPTLLFSSGVFLPSSTETVRLLSSCANCWPDTSPPEADYGTTCIWRKAITRNICAAIG